MATIEKNGLLTAIDKEGNKYLLYPITNMEAVDGLEEALADIETNIGNKVDKVSGKSLSTNDYTTAEKNKLSGIEAGANAYTHPNSGVAAGTYRSVTVNAQGHVTAGSNPTVTLAQGGTGATTAAAARTNLGLGSAATKNATTEIVSGGAELVTSGAVYVGLADKASSSHNHDDKYLSKSGGMVSGDLYVDGSVGITDFTKTFTYSIDMSDYTRDVWVPLIKFPYSDPYEPINFKLSVTANGESLLGGGFIDGCIYPYDGRIDGYGYLADHEMGCIIKNIDTYSSSGYTTLYVNLNYSEDYGVSDVKIILNVSSIDEGTVTKCTPTPIADDIDTDGWNCIPLRAAFFGAELISTNQLRSNSSTIYFVVRNGTSNSGVFKIQSGVLNPYTNANIELGSSNLKWKNIYASSGTIQTSDRNQKTDIVDMDSEKAQNLIMGLKPSTYKMVNGTSDRTHWGLISQDIEELMGSLGMSSLDFAGFIKSPKVEQIVTTDEKGRETTEEHIVEGEYEYSLRYDEFVAPMIKMIQLQQKKIEELEKKLDSLITA